MTSTNDNHTVFVQKAVLLSGLLALQRQNQSLMQLSLVAKSEFTQGYFQAYEDCLQPVALLIDAEKELKPKVLTVQ
jgi:hypothetical protein